MDLMVTTVQNPVIDAPKIKRKEYKHNPKERHQITRERNMRIRKEQRRIIKTTRKQLTKWP